MPIARELKGGPGGAHGGRANLKNVLITACCIAVRDCAHMGGSNETIMRGYRSRDRLDAAGGRQQAPVDPEEGIYQINIAKSTFRGPIGKNQTLNIGKDTYTVIGFDANGKPFSIVYPIINAEGQSRPVTGSAAYDTQSVTRHDPHTIKTVRTKDGKTIQTLISIYNPDAKTITVSAIGAAFSAVMVFEKQ